MARWTALAALSIGALVAAADPAQTPLRELPSDVVLTDALRRQIADVLARDKVPGYVLALVRPDAATPVEYANWGNATEDGRPMASDVRARSPLRAARRSY
jgi:hypothetical protein